MTASLASTARPPAHSQSNTRLDDHADRTYQNA